MADKIILLPEVVANQIAAGEVVNRPSSVVKEMMENAIDAGARSVKVNFRDGGRELIQIVDDGCGMSPIDARMAFDRHATSKIRSVEDIYALHTFGFRGEALASIAAVAQVELRTRQADDEMGTAVEIHGGKFVSQAPVMCPAGSQFFVRNLFFNVPARRRFLDKSTTSATQIKTEFQRVALCYPQIAFELYANDAPILSLPATSLAGRIVDIVGRHMKQNLLEIDADTSIARVAGYVGRPAAAKKRNAEQYLFVNGRYFKSAYLASAILKAYEKLIPAGEQPSYFLYLTIDPARIDVNVHPQKTEVKFADEEAIWQIVHAAVRETLAKTGAVPLMDFDRASRMEIPVMQQGVVYQEPSAMSNRNYNPFRESYIDPTAPDPNVDFTGFDVPYDDGGISAPETAPRGAAAGAGFVAAQPSDRLSDFSCGEESAFDEFESASDFIDDAHLPQDLQVGDAGTFEIASGTLSGGSALDFIPSGDPVQQRLDIGSHPVFSDPLPLGGGYLAALFDGRFLVVDIRRARERILYEDYLRMLGCGKTVSQQLLFPEQLTLSSEEYALLEEHAVEFAALGFDIDCCGDGNIEVKGTPADLPSEGIDRLVFELLQAFRTPLSAADMRREQIATLLACSAARTTPRSLSREEAAALLAQLAECGNISFSPSGKAILVEITPEELRSRLG